MMGKIQELKTFLSSPKKVVITTHHKPDADALGSSLGLWAFLKKLGHDVQVISPTDYPDFLFWMQGNDDVIIYENGNQQKSEKLIADADLIACLDFSVLKRINEMGELVRNSKAHKLLIDHHPLPEDFAHFNFHDTYAASTAELVFKLIVNLGYRKLIDSNLGECLYAGIMTDTGSFKHSNTTQTVHLVTAELIGMGVNVSKVAKLIYDSHSESRIRFLGFALSERLVVLPEAKTGYFAISQEDLKKFDSKTGDTEGLVNYALSVKGVNIAAVIIDRKVAVKLSFRSASGYSVNDFARKYFDGGGHEKAAGGQSTDSFEKTVERFLKAIEIEKENIINS
jgi:bifunctional oligoribonuclease and PAP phosphatase NrnA